MPPRKRKSSEPESDDSKQPPVTGEKRKRGRPRKYPESTTPKPPPGPKRGRGRPRKDASEKGIPIYSRQVPPKPSTPREGKRPVGRPRKYPLQNNNPLHNGSDASTSKSLSVDKDEEDDSDDNDDNDDDDEDDEDKDEERSYWLMKAEPETRMEKGVDVKFSIDDLRAATEPEPWNGIRNPVARKYLRAMKKGDQAFFYHSNCKVPGIVGIMEIVQEHSPDESALNPSDPYYDEKASQENPKWDLVHVAFRHKFPSIISLSDLKAQAGVGRPLNDLQTLKQSRLSVSAVTPAQWKFILRLAKEKAGGEESSDESE